MKDIIFAQDIVKFYSRKQILKKISLQVGPHSIFGLLGPNGAGKTTFIKCLLNLTPVSSGQLTLQGIPVQQTLSRKQVAYLPEKFNFFPYYTVKSTLEFFGRIHGLQGAELQKSIDEACEKINIKGIKNEKIKILSKGQLQRVGVAKLLVTRPSLLILDEPFSGLDPIGMKDLKDLLLHLKNDEKKTIFINSHILSEVEKICDEVAIIRAGEILIQGKIEDICEKGQLEEYFYKVIKEGTIKS